MELFHFSPAQAGISVSQRSRQGKISVMDWGLGAVPAPVRRPRRFRARAHRVGRQISGFSDLQVFRYLCFSWYCEMVEMGIIYFCWDI